MKKKPKKSTKSRNRKPFTCVIHGNGVDVDIKFDTMNDVGKLTEALTQAIRGSTPPMPAGLSEFQTEAEIAGLVSALSDDDLTMAQRAVEREVLRRQPQPEA
jgi:hypothetical protein